MKNFWRLSYFYRPHSILKGKYLAPLTKIYSGVPQSYFIKYELWDRSTFNLVCRYRALHIQKVLLYIVAKEVDLKMFLRPFVCLNDQVLSK